MLKILLAGSFLMLMVTVSHAQSPTQSRSDLEKERAAIQKEIEDVKRSLDETHKNKRQTLGQLALLQRRLKLRESAIRNINEQINVIQGDMNESWREILKLRRELDTLRIQYAESIVFAYKNRSSYDFLNFIFSSTSFNDAMKRIEYLKSYRAYREERAENIIRTQNLLQSKIDGLKVTRIEKEEAVKKQNKERTILEDEKKEKDAVVNRLKSQEKELKKEMAAKQKQDQKLAGAIAAAIKRARDLAIKEAKTKNAAAAAADKAAAKPSRSSEPSDNTAASLTPIKSSSKTVFSTDEDVHLSGNFEKNKGHLPWPVSGTVSMAFGPHEYIKGIIHNNQGVTIDVNAGAAVKAVFEGVVTSVFSVGDVNAVIIRHGKYFTTYSNLSTVSVSKGDQVKTAQIIGRVGEIGQLEFVLSDEKDHMFDPERWLTR
ncbi:peptidoglycan DD-metalloendopeptidase family protein [Flavitalea sp. BT771]|uniref:murein hydrolase activator EnvC family protein n=1 Tax=Flavitalea sp. BT771 TaxID=3063329 RepID=UPI0026E29419|nr:peptidoglycan DD-metalloendopeptidase family protein [Flavitalea sp. BT771]MDO6432944.1 peptidoglycan DD-metalloendopeptidase family protein [Flavitalea sp. BT771]MDV6221780.1 peptidoglycan DD-metalloendopeptidase family protein [Flavitalea sp. BT771]